MVKREEKKRKRDAIERILAAEKEAKAARKDELVEQAILETTEANRLGTEQLNNALTNMKQAIHTQRPIADEHFLCFDSNPDGNTANKLIRMLRHNNGNGQYGTCVFSIDEELKFTCAFAITTIGACGAPITKLIPLSEMVLYCHTNRLYEFVSFCWKIN